MRGAGRGEGMSGDGAALGDDPATPGNISPGAGMVDYGPDDSGEEMETASAPIGLGQGDSRMRRSDSALTTEALPEEAPEAATEFPLDPELLPGGPGDASDVAGRALSSYIRMPLDWRNEGTSAWR